MEQLLSIRPVDNRRGLTGQFLQDLVQGAGVKQPCGLAKRTQRCSPNPQSSLDSLKGRRLLKGAQAGDRGTEEVEQEETDVLVEEQLAVARTVALGADVLEPRQQGCKSVEVLQTLDVTWLQISSTSSRHLCLPAIPAVSGYA